jgi:hypothetical protein
MLTTFEQSICGLLSFWTGGIVTVNGLISGCVMIGWVVGEVRATSSALAPLANPTKIKPVKINVFIMSPM